MLDWMRTYPLPSQYAVTLVRVPTEAKVYVPAGWPAHEGMDCPETTLHSSSHVQSRSADEAKERREDGAAAGGGRCLWCEGDEHGGCCHGMKLEGPVQRVMPIGARRTLHCGEVAVSKCSATSETTGATTAAFCQPFEAVCCVVAAAAIPGEIVTNGAWPPSCGRPAAVGLFSNDPLLALLWALRQPPAVEHVWCGVRVRARLRRFRCAGCPNLPRRD